MPFVSLSNSRIYYEMQGPSSAPVLVLSNSLGTNLELWNPQAAEFAREFRVLRYDMRGHGLSEVSAAPYSVEQLAKDVLALLDALNLHVVNFCGLSIGGAIGMALAACAPQRLHKLVLSNTAAKIGTSESWNARIAAVRRGGMEGIVDPVLERWFTAEFRQRNPEAIAGTRSMLLTTPPEGYVGCCEALREMDQRNAVGQVRVPTLVIAGASDSATTPAEAQLLVNAIAGAKYIELQAAHLSNVEAAPEFNSNVLRFLRG